MFRWLPMYAPADDGGGDGSVVTDTPPVEEDLVVVDELPVEGAEEDEVDTGGKSIKEILAENEQLRQQADQGSAIQRGIADLGSVLKSNQVPQQAPAQIPGETREEYAKRFNKEFFADKPYDVLEDAVKRLMSPVISEVRQSVATVNRAFYKDDFIYKKYRDEVEAKIAGLPVEQKQNPAAMEWAIKQVKADHIDDLVELKVQEAMERAQNAAPVQQHSNSVNKKGTFVEGGGNAAPAQRKVTAITRAEKEAINVYIGRGMSREAATSKILRDRRM